MSLVAFLLLAACSGKPVPCVNEVQTEALSPDGQQKAVVFIRKCSDGGSATTHVSILAAHAALPEGNGNIFGSEHPIGIRAAWLNDAHLVLYSYGNLSKATRRERAGTVVIEYSQIMETDLVAPLDR